MTLIWQLPAALLMWHGIAKGTVRQASFSICWACNLFSSWGIWRGHHCSIHCTKLHSQTIASVGWNFIHCWLT